MHRITGLLQWHENDLTEKHFISAYEEYWHSNQPSKTLVRTQTHTHTHTHTHTYAHTARGMLYVL